MKQSVVLRTASVLLVLLFMIHLVDDITRGFEKGGPSNLAAIPIFGVWLYGTLVLGERRSGYIIMLLGGLFGLFVPVAHMRGKGLGVVATAGSSGGFVFSFTVIAIGVTALFSFMLAVQGLWSARRGGPGRTER